MDAKSFCDWMERMDINGVEFSQATGISRNTITRYRREGTPLYIDLACAALSYGLKPMGYTVAPSIEEDTPENAT